MKSTLKDDNQEKYPPTKISPTRSDLCILMNPFLQIESAIQVEMTRRSLKTLPLTVVERLIQKSVQRHHDKGWNENVLHEFLTVTCPRLYKVENDSTYRGGRWQIRSVQCQENRIILLQQLLKECSTNLKLDSNIDQAIKESRKAVTTSSSFTLGQQNTHMQQQQQQQQQHQKNALDMLQSSSSQQIKVEGSTVEERVRARAMLKEERNRQYQKETNSNIESERDRWCVKIADILQLNASSTVRRQAKFHPTEKCCMTLEDAVVRVQGQVPLKRRQIVDYLLEMSTRVPEWILLDVTNNETVSKTTSVWLSPHIYRSVRYRLLKEDKTTTPRKTLFSKDTSQLSNTNSVLKATPLTTTTPANKETATKSINTTTTTNNTNTTTTKRTLSHPTIDTVSSLNKSSHKKQRRTTDDELRINPNLIWTDADYDGGEVIPLTFFHSARGLKRLFDQMKAGRRI